MDSHNAGVERYTTCIGSAAMVADTCHSSTQEAEAGESEFEASPSYLVRLSGKTKAKKLIYSGLICLLIVMLTNLLGLRTELKAYVLGRYFSFFSLCSLSCPGHSVEEAILKLRD